MKILTRSNTENSAAGSNKELSGDQVLETTRTNRVKLLRKSKLIEKLDRKRVSSSHQHDSFSASDNSQTQGLQESTKMMEAGASSVNQQPLIESIDQASPEEAENMEEGNSNFQSQRSQIAELRESVMAHMKAQEVLYVPKILIVSEKNSESNRQKLTTWIFQLVDRFRFRQDTGFLAVNIIDRTMGLVSIGTSKLALLGVTALLMAVKYEEIMVPRIKQMVELVGSQYNVSKNTVLNLQSNLLLLLDFNLGFNSPLLFIADECSSRKLQHQVKVRADQLARELTIKSQMRYQLSSKLAAYAISLAESEMGI